MWVFEWGMLSAYSLCVWIMCMLQILGLRQYDWCVVRVVNCGHWNWELLCTGEVCVCVCKAEHRGLQMIQVCVKTW